MDGGDEVRAFLRGTGLATYGDEIELEPLVGGVSSDIWRAGIGPRAVCVKRALPLLRVARRWEAPVTRSTSEWAWLSLVSELAPGATPHLYAHDRDAGFIAMEYLPPDRFANWKLLLRDGVVSLATATAVGDTLGRIHAATADDPGVAAQFATDDAFYALRIKPYLVDCAAAHPELAELLSEIVRVTVATKRVLVHGDVSPKNILVGPNGPCFIDAECAWYGDPAFDLAFVLNHLLLKAVWQPRYTRSYREAFGALAHAYVRRVCWEPRDELEARCARLLPALTLARIDGTSPVEYITRDAERAAVRAVAGGMIRTPLPRLEDVAEAWSAVAT